MNGLSPGSMTSRSAFRLYALCGFAAIGAAAYYPRFIKANPGVSAYVSAAECMLRGETPLHCDATLFTYPPFFALLMVPFVSLPDWLVELIWYAVLLVTLAVALPVSEALTKRVFPGGWTARELVVFRCVALLLFLKFMLAVLENQSFDSIALIFLLLGVLAMVNGRQFAAGAGIAVAAALKVTPLIFLPYLLLKRRFAAAAAFVVVFAVLLVLPDLLLPPKQSWHTVTWLREVALGPFAVDPASIRLPFWVGANPLNQSMRGAISRIVDELKQPELFAVATYAVVGTYIVTVGALILKSLRDDRLVPVDCALLMISMLLLSPVSSRSHFVALILPYMLALAAVRRGQATRTVGTVVLSLSFLLATGSSNDVVGQAVSEWGHWYGLMTWGTLVLVVPLGMVIWTMTPVAGDKPCTVKGGSA